MPRKKKTEVETEGEKKQYKLPPALTEEALENQMIMKAYEVVYQRMCDGTVTSPELVHFLRLGSTKEREDRDFLNKRKELLEAKTKAINESKNIEELYSKAIEAMRSYSGAESESEDDMDD